MTLPDHLGGHCGYTNEDVGVLDTLIRHFRPKSFLDIGCGPGGMIRQAARRGIEAWGVDGDYTLDFGDIDIVIHDFTSGPLDLDREFDLGWSVELLEHVDERYLENIQPAFGACRHVFITHALPGQPGHHHVNCRPDGYWISVFSAWGFRFNPVMTDIVRGASTMRCDYARKTGMFFERI